MAEEVIRRVAGGTALYPGLLPAWILGEIQRRPLRPRFALLTLLTMAAWDTRDDVGNITDIHGGKLLADLCGISKRTLRRHLAVLHAAGYIVITCPGTCDSRTVYAIPGHPGALDDQAATRPVVIQAIVPGETDARGRTKRVPRQLKLAGQGSFFDLGGGEVNADRTPRSILSAPADNTDRTPRSVNAIPVSQVGFDTDRTPPHVHGMYKTHVHVASTKQNRGGKPWLKDVTAGDLSDDTRLAALLRRTIRLGIGRFAHAQAEDPRIRLQWWSMAECCLRVGDDPARLFASHVSRDTGWLYISQADEDAAIARLKPRRQPERSRHRSAGPGPAVDQDAPRWSAMDPAQRRDLLSKLLPRLGPQRRRDVSALSGEAIIRLAQQEGVI